MGRGAGQEMATGPGHLPPPTSPIGHGALQGRAGGAGPPGPHPRPVTVAWRPGGSLWDAGGWSAGLTSSCSSCSRASRSLCLWSPCFSSATTASHFCPSTFLSSISCGRGGRELLRPRGPAPWALTPCVAPASPCLGVQGPGHHPRSPPRWGGRAVRPWTGTLEAWVGWLGTAALARSPSTWLRQVFPGKGVILLSRRLDSTCPLPAKGSPRSPQDTTQPQPRLDTPTTTQ